MYIFTVEYHTEFKNNVGFEVENMVNEWNISKEVGTKTAELTLTRSAQ
jgi:hypothetical protein